MKIKFGKYSGLTFKQIAIKDPAYLIWLYDSAKFESDRREAFLALFPDYEIKGMKAEIEGRASSDRSLGIPFIIYQGQKYYQAATGEKTGPIRKGYQVIVNLKVYYLRSKELKGVKRINSFEIVEVLSEQIHPLTEAIWDKKNKCFLPDPEGAE